MTKMSMYWISCVTMAITKFYFGNRCSCNASSFQCKSYMYVFYALILPQWYVESSFLCKHILMWKIVCFQGHWNSSFRLLDFWFSENSPKKQILQVLNASKFVFIKKLIDLVSRETETNSSLCPSAGAWELVWCGQKPLSLRYCHIICLSWWRQKYNTSIPPVLPQH